MTHMLKGTLILNRTLCHTVSARKYRCYVQGVALKIVKNYMKTLKLKTLIIYTFCIKFLKDLHPYAFSEEHSYLT